MERNILDFIELHLQTTQPLEKELNDARWKCLGLGRQNETKRLEEAQKARDAVFADRESYARILTYDEGGMTETETTKRQLRLLRLAFAACQLPPAALERLAEEEFEIDQLIESFRVAWEGKDLSLRDVEDEYYEVGDTDDRFQLWERTNVLAERLGPAILRLIGIRNRASRELDYRDYYQMALDLQELSEPRLFLTIEDLVRKTHGIYHELKEELDVELGVFYAIDPGELAPWHYTDTLFAPNYSPPAADVDKLYGRKDLLAIAKTFFDGIGLPVDDIIRRSDFAGREDKHPEPMCIHVDRNGKDVRISTVGDAPEEKMEQILHWLGVGAYHRYLAPSLPSLLRRPCHPVFIEAIGILMSRFSRDSQFLIEVVGADKDAVAAAAPILAEQERRDLLIKSRWIPVLVHFERALYENPGQDLNRTWWDLVHYYLGIEPPSMRSGRHDWAIHLEISRNPIRCHNNLLAEMISSQIMAAVQRQCGSTFIGNPEVGRFLREKLFSLGSTKPWITMLESATGEPLKTSYFFEDRLVKK